LAPVEGLNA